MNVDEAIASWKQAPFARGSTDCCAFVDHVLKEVTGYSFLPSYDDDKGAAAILEQHGSLENAVTNILDQLPVEPSALTLGDIALVDIRGHESIGIMQRNSVAVVIERIGLREVSTEFVDCGWKAWA